jgi:hypothetical protein
MFDVIEKLKSEWTDRYVVIDSKAPELARFANATGTVKTVNMNGRCLVQFDQFNNVGWYDIDPACLRIVTEPLPKPAEPAKAAKPAGESAKPAAAKPAAKPAAEKPAAAKPAAAKGAGKPSTADILAAARAKSAAAGAGGAAGESAAKKPAAGGKPSTAEILARARAGKGAAAPVEPASVEPAEPAEEPAAAPAAPATETQFAKQAAKQAEKPPAKQAGGKKAASGSLPTSTAEKIAWCRQHDGGK